MSTENPQSLDGILHRCMWICQRREASGESVVSHICGLPPRISARSLPNLGLSSPNLSNSSPNLVPLCTLPGLIFI